MSNPSVHPGHASQPVGMRAVVVYKFSKAAVFAGLATVLFCTNSGWLHQEVTRLSAFLVGHASSRIAAWLADELAKLGTPRALFIAKLALAGDAVVSAAEGYFLRRGYWWAPWVVVVATGVLLPFEVASFIRKPQVPRILIILVNAAIVAYLARAARLHRVAHLKTLADQERMGAPPAVTP